MTETRYFLRKVTNGNEIPIAPVMSVGRSEESNLRLTEGQPSRHHAKITADQNQVFVEDLGSTNGTFVNGRRLDAKLKLKLTAGDQLRFDIEEFMFVAPAPAVDGEKTEYRAPDPEKTQYRPPAGNEAASRGAGAADPARLSKSAPGESAAAARKDPPGTQDQGYPGSFVDPKDNATVWVGAQKRPNPGSSSISAPAHSAGDPPYFWIDSGNSAGKKIGLNAQKGAKPMWRIGSGKECDVRLDDTGVSAQHATLHRQDRAWLLTDDLSVNGTFVNDKKILRGYLTTGDQVRFGPVECRFYIPPQAGERDHAGAPLRRYGLIAAAAFALTLALLYAAYRFFQ